jgi:Leucine-rich repeat (LRR) protein
MPGMPAKANPEDVLADPEDEAVLREIRACVPSLCCEGGWWPEELEPKMWNGVQFGGGLYPTHGDETRVYRLDLSQGMCVGAETLPWEVIAKFPRLRKLWLNGNRLKRVGMEIGTCPTLEDLNLTDKQLEGSDALPWELGDIASLQKLKLDGNETLGFLPSSIAKLTSLSDLNLADCGLERINPMLGRDLVALDYLRVGDNKFEPGGLPAEWAVGGTLEKNGSIVYGNESHVFVDGALTYVPTTAE